MEDIAKYLGKKVKVTYDDGKYFVGHVVYGEETFNEGKYMLRTTGTIYPNNGVLYLAGEGGINVISIEIYGTYRGVPHE